MLRYGRAVRATFTRLVVMSQAAFFGLLFVCICLHPGYLFSRNEGGISNFGVHAATVAPFTGAFVAAACFLAAASRVAPREVPGARRLATVLAVFAGILVCVLATTYPYQHGLALRDLHFFTGAAAICFEVAVAGWLLATFDRGARELTAAAAALAGFALALLTVVGLVHALFVAQLVTSVAFGVLLVAASTTLERRMREPA
jgi:hypothetical protein